MECIEARALKPSLRREVSMKSTQQVFLDDILCLNGANGVNGDEFSVDDLLDLSNEKFEDVFVHEEEEEDEEEEKDSLSFSSQERVDEENSNSSSFCSTGDFDPFLADELAVPTDDLKDLEWLSQFVDDSQSEFSLLWPPGNFKEKMGFLAENRSDRKVKPAATVTHPLFPTPVPAKPRSKRSRTTHVRWSLGSVPFTESSSTASFSPSSSTPCLIFSNLAAQTMDLFNNLGKPPAKKPKKKLSTAPAVGGSQAQRRCTHCQVQKTPQWRTGPLGPKTLCNACGVRFKSGRLFPEYRPACSPTFSEEVHSNSHRKVLEIRRRKEVAGPESGLTQLIPIC